MIKSYILIAVLSLNIYAASLDDSMSSIGSNYSQTIEMAISPYKKTIPTLHNRYKNTKNEYQQIKDKFLASLIPPFFALIPYAESKFNPNVHGRGTAGLWQFTAPTARNFGLLVNKNIDERKDIERSTQATIKLLLYLKREFKEWYLVDFAYAMGEGTLRKLIKQSGTDIDKLLENPNFPKGTKAHFAKTIMLDSLINQTDINTTNIE